MIKRKYIIESSLFMKRVLILSLLLSLLLCGCAQETPAQIAATTLPVYEFTARLCEGTGITVTRLVTEQVSCLHDYSLNVRQVKAAEAANVVVISGAGLEDFLEDVLFGKQTIDASEGIELIVPEEHHHDEEENHHAESHDGHNHEQDPHIWLSPVKAQAMVRNICIGLTEAYPEQASLFSANEKALLQDLADLQHYGEETLSRLSCRELITFHDGFGYFAQAFDLTILEAVEEESGSEASAKELIHLIEEVEHHDLPAIFTEVSGSVSAAEVIARETGCESFQLSMAMSGDSYFDAMYANIHTILEALE